MKIFRITLLLSAFFMKTHGYHILGLFPVPSRSHMIMFESLMRGLAEKGHKVDVMSHFPLKKPILGYNEISLKGVMPILENNISITLIKEKLGDPFKAINFILNDAGINVCEATFSSSVAKDLLKTKKKYDLIITEVFGSDCMLGFVHRFKVPVIGMTSSVSLPWGSDRVGNPDNPSYIPNYFLPHLSTMSLKERVLNTLASVGSKLKFTLSQKDHNTLAKKFFGPDLPDLQQLAHNISLIFINSHFSTNQARPTVPNFVEVGGLHIQPPKLLAKHFNDLLNISNTNYKGVIYLSMGSMVMTETLPLYKLRALFGAFKELPYKVIWKAVEEKMPKELDIPSNIHFERWLPQMDILCHPNVKLFVAHGGLLGTQEGIYCGVPRLGIPFFADQELNLKTSAALNIAKLIYYDDVSKENILEAAQELLENPTYKENALKISQLFKDRPSSPMETAIYWVEYVIKYNGAPHLRSVGADLPLYQYYLIDVLTIFVVMGLTVTIAVYYCSKMLFRMLNSKNSKKKKHE